MASNFTGDTAKAYRETSAEMKRDPAFAAGREFEQLMAKPKDLRQTPIFKGLVEIFVKKYPGTRYAKQAQAGPGDQGQPLTINIQALGFGCSLHAELPHRRPLSPSHPRRSSGRTAAHRRGFASARAITQSS